MGRRPWMLFAGIATILLLSTTMASLLSARASGESWTPVHVPFGMLGDHATYTRHTITAAGTSTHAWHLELRGHQAVPAADGTPVAAILVERSFPVNENTTGVGSSYHLQGTRTFRTFADPSTRATVNHQEVFTGIEEEWAQEYYRRWNKTASTTLFGPFVSESATSQAVVADFWLRLQGQDIQPAMSTAQLLEAFAASFPPTPGQPWRLESVSVSVEPAPNATLVVKAHACGEPLFSRVEVRERIVFFGFYLDQPVPTCIRTSTSLRNGIPYPVKVETEVRPRGLSVIETRDELAGFLPGHSALPWVRTPPVLTVDAPPIGGTLEPHPRDGPRHPLPYTLADAISNVQQDATLAAFQAWRTQHPANNVVGLEFYPVEGGGWQWSLMFADAGGNHFEVRSQKMTGKAPQNYENRNALLNARGTPPPARGVVITLDDAHDRFTTWRQSEETPNFLEWGVGGITLCANPACAGGPGALTLDRPSGAHVLVIGNTPDRVLEGPSAIIRSPNEHFNELWIDAQTGRMIQGRNHTFSEPGRVPTLEAVTGTWPITQSAAPPSSVLATPRMETASAIAIPLLAAFLAIYFYPTLKLLGSQAWGWFAGYAKLRKEAILGHPLRDELVNLIRAEPGVTPAQAAKTLHHPLTTLVYHLRVLETNHVIAISQDGRHKRLFAATVAPKDRTPGAALKNSRTRRLFDLIRERPEATQRELAALLGIRQPSLLWHVRRLARAGLIRQRRVGRHVRYFVADGPQLSSL